MKYLTVLLLSLFFIGCGGAADSNLDSESSSNLAGSAGKKPRIALVMKSLANEFFSTMAEGASQYQSEHPDEFELIINGIKDERDLSRQVALVEEMVASNVDAIVIAPADSKALVPALRRAKKAGVVVVNIDNRLDRDVLAQEKVSIPFVGPDNKAGAEKVGEFLASRINKGDSVCILEGVRTSFNGQQRLAGFEAAMDQAGMAIVDRQSAEWEMSKANTISSSMLNEHPEIKAILAANDSMALGAVAAVKSAGRSGEVKIVGFDNISAVQEAIKEGKVLATVDQHGDQLAVFGIQAALKLLSEPNSVVKDVETPVDLITLESLAQ
ncbi:sugar ABC transporter substrate-binding protein [Calycomorphotria hydatis]|uniref:D-ribose-binding periplasmic protein n=1 Tax=Calycomorphotria hydatis TaxID=2528027 RepID=A0A517T623_9PLAN|nr:sugar ABC transporter substrate-binding protein [Calycomorphotria hydatis]QDT63827.1 D-ribose-binding periplasmic protein precursor [Calycomorphotria hydatis]